MAYKGAEVKTLKTKADFLKPKVKPPCFSMESLLAAAQLRHIAEPGPIIYPAGPERFRIRIKFHPFQWW